MEHTYVSRTAQDAERAGYGDGAYWAYLDESALRLATYYRERGDDESADRMLTRSLSEALASNDGD
jgi:hypothetical protein